METVLDTLTSRALLDSLPMGVVVIDNRGHVVWNNPMVCTLLGFNLQGQTWRTWINTLFIPKEDDGYEVSTYNGKKMTILPVSVRGEEGQIILLIDVTETREWQEKIGIHKRMSDLGRMMSQITHQIKTPLSSALLCSSYLIDQNAGFSEKQAQYLLKIKENIFQIDHYIDSILNFSKGHTQVVEVICLQTLLKEVTRTIEEKIKSTGAVLTVFNSVTEVFWGNRQAWLGVFLNMIDNAIEAVDDQARIMIHARLQADTLCISFQDQGPGISQALKQKIFDPFFTTKAKGTGLGMTIVKSVVEAHQGRVVLSDLPHGQTGTHIMIHIPISKRSRVA